MRERVITSSSNPVFKRLKSLTSPHSRRKADTFLLEGPKFIFDALKAGISFKTLVASEDYEGPFPEPASDTQCLRLSSKLFKQISSTSTSQGLVAEAARRWTELAEMTAAGRHLLVAWDVQDPGNIGTIIRSCAAFGMGGVVVSPGCADPFSPRAVRASAGAILHHPVARAATLPELLDDLREAGYSTCWTGPEGEKPDWTSLRAGRLAVFVGSEGRGFDNDQKELIGSGLRVPILPQVESLNAGVIASILAYELAGRSL
jgi:TrmH family RNA methyltransferase